MISQKTQLFTFKAKIQLMRSNAWKNIETKIYSKIILKFYTKTHRKKKHNNFYLDNIIKIYNEYSEPYNNYNNMQYGFATGP